MIREVYGCASRDQERLWIVHEMRRRDHSLNVQCAYELDGDIDVHRVMACVDAIVSRHDSLRTRFECEGSRVVRVIVGRVETPSRRVDVPCRSESYADERNRLLEEEWRVPFDLSLAPLFRLLLISRERDPLTMVLTAHHNICDAKSMDVFVRELCDEYDGAAVKGERWYKPVLSFGEYVLARKRCEASEPYRASLEFWKTKYETA
jgi:NRPS condensation-like uncharacterized protein